MNDLDQALLVTSPIGVCANGDAERWRRALHHAEGSGRVQPGIRG
jgi:hypothetical protein